LKRERECVCVCVRERERERKREDIKESKREQDRWLEGKNSVLLPRDVIQITSRLGQRDFGDFLPTDVLTLPSEKT
jgi:hypothetical protein